MTATAKPAPQHGGWIIAACMFASSLAFLDGSVTNVAALVCAGLAITAGLVAFATLRD